MATNTLINDTKITRESLRILHQKLNFISNIDLQYDDSFAVSGAKVGSSLKLRLPNQFTTRTGATYSAQDVTEASETLTVGTQKGIDFEFSSAELTMDIDSFSERYLEPAMSQLAATIEADALSMYKDVYNVAGADASALTFKNVMEGKKVLTDNLAPLGSRAVILDTQSCVDILDATKGLFQSDSNIKAQYREGVLGRMGGFDWYENTLMPRHTTGTAVNGDTLYNINGAAESGATLTVDTGTTTFLAGDVITIDGVFRVHPETKVSTAVLQNFVVTANSGASAVSLSVSPALTATGARQNVSNVPADNAAINKLNGGASSDYDQSLAFHKQAFAIAFADLEKPNGVDMCAREMSDNISLRFIRDYDVSADMFKSRFDVYYGYKTARPQLAARLIAN
jgi:hypothetical protein